MTNNNMKKPPANLDGARVLKYAILDESVIHTGKIALYVGGKLMRLAACIAICKYDGKDNYFIIYCNKNWRSFGAAGHKTIEEAMSSLEKEYSGITNKWQNMS